MNDGDTIYLDGGTYVNDAVKWEKKNLKFIGMGTSQNPTVMKYTGDISNGKGIWVFEQPGVSDNAYIENITFDGAQVSDGNGGNGAGIRYQSVNLHIRNCCFVNCQNGILEGGNYNGSQVIIENSEFSNNGYNGSNSSYIGYEHHIYISANTDSFVVMNCHFHDPRGQANSLKTRAQRSYILYNLIDEASGNGSWELNIAQGGMLVVIGNVIIQGPSGANHGIIGWDAVTNPLEELYFINNTVINKFAGNVRFVNVSPVSDITAFKFYNNIFASTTGASNTLFSGNIPAVLDTSNNLFIPNFVSFNFANSTDGDFNLLASATTAIDHGANPGQTSTGYNLAPAFMFQSDTLPLLQRNISGAAIDIGAYEYGFPTFLSNEMQNQLAISVFPNPMRKEAIIEMMANDLLDGMNFSLYNVQGQVVMKDIPLVLKKTKITAENLPLGIYLYKVIRHGEMIVTGKIVLE
ncbi:MAG: T9SS type A sorting domain-containing protein [Bacteroidetes bacterium]|nr:T9SS type A sorting domain-containing protein [Bacteroidota bacterium]